MENCVVINKVNDTENVRVIKDYTCFGKTYLVTNIVTYKQAFVRITETNGGFVERTILSMAHGRRMKIEKRKCKYITLFKEFDNVI